MDNQQMSERVAAIRADIEKQAPEPPLDKAAEVPDTEKSTAAPPAPQDDSSEASAPSTGDPAPAKPKVEPWFQKRIDQLTWEKHEAERRAEALEQQVQAYQPKPEPTPQGRPTLEQFNYDQDAYDAARDQWAVQEAIKAVRAEQLQTEAQRQVQAKLSTVQERIAKFEEKVPGGWTEAMQAPMNITPPMLETIAESEKGPEIAHYLAKHLDEANAIANLSPLGQVRALGRIEERLSAPVSAPPPKKVSAAPAPPPVGQSAAKVDTPLAEQSIEDRIRHIRGYQR